MATLPDLLDAVRQLLDAQQDLNSKLHHLQVADFDTEAFMSAVTDLADIPKLNLARATDAQQFRWMHEALLQKIRTLQLGRITRAELDEVENLAAQLGVIVHSATYPIFEQINDLEDPADS